MRRSLALLLVAACPGPTPDPVAPAAGGSARPTPATDAAVEASQEEKLAAIQQAMNVLDEAAQTCWARAATERFDIEGQVVATIEIESATKSRATIARDTTRSPKLTGCLVQLLEAYRWAPPLHAQAIQLPFQFRAPAGQNVIDRELVDWTQQGQVGVAVLVDENNTGNAAASLLEVGIAPGASTGMRRAERAELWYFRAYKPAEHAALAISVATATGTLQAKAGDMMFVPAGAVRDIAVQGGQLRAVVALVPGGREGAARKGALPTPPASPPRQPAPPAPVIVRGDSAVTAGPAKIFVEAARLKGTPLAATILTLSEGAKVAEHVHDKETELLFVLAGRGTMTVAGVAVEVTPTSVIQIPAGTKHAFEAKLEVQALQLYTPPGPEQRFKKVPK